MEALSRAHCDASPAVRYGIALMLFALALALRLWLLPVELGVAFATFYPAVALAFYFGGLGPGVLALVFSAVTGYYIFAPPQWSFDYSRQGLVATAGFVISSTVVGWIVLRMQRVDRRLQAALAEAQDLFDNAPVGYHSLDASGRIMRVNATEAAWIGVPAAALIGRRLTDFAAEADRGNLESRIAAFIANGDPGQSEFDLQPVGVPGRRVRASYVAVRDDTGRFLRSRSVLFDISEAHAVSLQAQRLLTEQAAMLDNELVGMVRLRQRVAVWKNKAVERIFGYEHDELIGRPARMLYRDDESFEAVGRVAYQAISNGRPFRTQLQMRRKDGSPVWVDAYGAAIAPGSDETLWMLSDITAIKRGEEARVNAARLEAENRQLRETEALKSGIVANLSHEMRTPLNGILGFGHLLASGSMAAGGPRVAHYGSQIVTSGQRLLAMVERVLDLAQLEAGRLPLQPTGQMLSRLVEDLVATYRPMAEAKPLSLFVVHDPAIGVVTVDALRTQQVLASFLTNALAFTPADGRITVRTHAESPTHLRIEVEDTGIGIAEADLPRLFSSFEQLSEGRTKTHQGAGLSLALTKRLAKAMGGSVGVRSRLGEGSVFHVLLPRQFRAGAQEDNLAAWTTDTQPGDLDTPDLLSPQHWPPPDRQADPRRSTTTAQVSSAGSDGPQRG